EVFFKPLKWLKNFW
ncbi:unnamed protein product, partial [Allacma fusca]